MTGQRKGRVSQAPPTRHTPSDPSIHAPHGSSHLLSLASLQQPSRSHRPSCNTTPPAAPSFLKNEIFSMKHMVDIIRGKEKVQLFPPGPPLLKPFPGHFCPRSFTYPPLPETENASSPLVPLRNVKKRSDSMSGKLSQLSSRRLLIQELRFKKTSVKMLVLNLWVMTLPGV